MHFILFLKKKVFSLYSLCLYELSEVMTFKTLQVNKIYKRMKQNFKLSLKDPDDISKINAVFLMGLRTVWNQNE